MFSNLVAAFVFVFSFSALASDPAHQPTEGKTRPANRYSGSAPIDLGRGLPFNNGTYGSRNEEYEQQSTGGYLAPGVRATPYTYNQRGMFVSKVKDLFPIYEEAIENLKQNKDERAEVKAYREQQLSEMQKRLDSAKDAIKRADGANEGEWPGAQEQARQAFADLQATLVRFNTRY
jgi:hypothetical protein